MSLSEKYGIPQEKIRALIKDGWITCSVTKYEEVIYIYKRNLTEGKTKLQAISNTAEAARVSDRQVYRIIHKFD
jgi:hypothetical protein